MMHSRTCVICDKPLARVTDTGWGVDKSRYGILQIVEASASQTIVMDMECAEKVRNVFRYASFVKGCHCGERKQRIIS